jgi:aminopeptidase N
MSNRITLFLLISLGLFAVAYAQNELTADNKGYDQEHILLDLSFDIQQHTVFGREIFTFRATADSLQHLVLHARTMTIDTVRQGDTLLDFEHQKGLLEIALNRPATKGEQQKVEIQYTATPDRGLYFFHPTETVPQIPVQIWSQGQGHDNRHWFPCFDRPGDKYTHEMKVTIPDTLDMISNGNLIQTIEHPESNQVTFHWSMPYPMVSYLTTLVVGSFNSWTDTVRTLPVSYYIPRHYSDVSFERVFGETPAMIDFYTDIIGPYPYNKYDQVVVHDFKHGGMENATATTLNSRVLLDIGAVPSYSPNGLIAHELVHQWFGNLLTFTGWPHSWLHEGFATYYTDLFFEHRYGRDEFLYRRYRQNQDYLTMREHTPMGSQKQRDFGIPADLGGRITYNRGAAILDMLRTRLGEDRFHAAIKHYVKDFEWKHVNSETFRHSLQQHTGETLTTFFDQWIYGAGHPQFMVDCRWEAEKSRVRLDIQQIQPDSGAVPTFDVVVPIEITAGTFKRSFKTRIWKRHQTVYFQIPQHPQMIRFNKYDTILAETDITKSFREWRYQALYDDDVLGRLYALDALETLQPQSTPVIIRVLRQDPFYGPRMHAATILGHRNRGEAGEEALIQSLKDPDPRVREAAALALNTLQAESELHRLQRMDPNDYVRAAAVYSLITSAREIDMAFLQNSLSQSSHHNIIRQRVFQACQKRQTPIALPLAAEYIQYRYSQGGMHELEQTILDYAESLIKEYPQDVIPIFKRGLENPSFRVRRHAARLIGQYDIKSAEPLLRDLFQTDRRSRVRPVLSKALKALSR